MTRAPERATPETRNDSENRALTDRQHPTVRTAIFDFGGVFTTSPLGLVRSAASDASIEPDQLVELMIGDYCDHTNHPWQRVESGDLPLADARTWCLLESRRRFGTEIDPMTVMKPLLTEPLRQPMLDLVSELNAAGMTTALLTNNVRELRGQWSAMTDWDALFDQVIDSSEVGVRKPSADAYRLALDRCREPDPTRAVMIDDFAANVDGARGIGMRGVLVGEDPSVAMAEIRELLRS